MNRLKIALFTSNQPRHISMAEKLIEMGHEVHVVQEITTLLPGKKSGIFQSSKVMAAYFARVLAAERTLFGTSRGLAGASSILTMPIGELSDISLDVLAKPLDCDLHIVFGCSYIKGELVNELIDRKAINIHMGISPYFRGSSCNFWALYDNYPELVGATVHHLSKGLDSGPILFHSFPKTVAANVFEFSMSAVDAVFDDILDQLQHGALRDAKGVPQDITQQIRYSRSIDFTDEVAEEFMERSFDPISVKRPQALHNLQLLSCN